MTPAIITQLIFGFVFAGIVFVLSVIPAAITERLTRFAAGYSKWPRRATRTLMFFVLFGFEIFCLERANIYKEIILILFIPLRG